MKFKKVISLALSLALVFGSIACSIMADAASYNATVLDYMINNHDYFREDRYTAETYQNYETVLASATAVNSSASATADEINAAVADLAAAEAALTLTSAGGYRSKLNFRVPSTVLSGATITVKFKDALDNALTDIAVVATGATATDFAMGEDGFYTAELTATGATGEFASLDITYVYDSVTYLTHINVLIAADGASTATKNVLGSYIARELAKNRQAADYSAGFQTYASVMKSSTGTYANPSSTQTKVTRAIENIDLALQTMTTSLADYSVIYSLIAQADELDPENYNSLADLTNAIALVEYDLPSEQQSYVDAMAANIQAAFDNLTLKVARYTVVCVTDSGEQLSSTRYDGRRTYVVRATAPIFPGYAPNVEYQTVTLAQDETTVTFVYTPVTYYAYFDPNGGTVPITSKQLTYDQEYGELPVAVKDGYSFLGWFSNLSGGEQIFADTIVTVNYVETLYARWSGIESYTIDFNSGLGSVCDSITGTYGSEVTLPTPTRYGYQFLGWFYEDTFTSAADFETMPDLGDDGDAVTLYAKWVERTYDIVLDPGENGTIASPAYSVTYGSTYGDIPEAQKEGYTFVGWFTAADETGTEILSTTPVELDDTHTLYAHYTVNTYTLTFDMDGGDEIAAITQAYGTPVVLPTQPSKEYYLFAGWTLEGDAFELTTMPAGNVTIKAVWTLNTVCEYYIEPYKTVGGVTIPANTIKEGDALQVKVSIKTNYPVGQAIFGIMFDKRVFSLSGTSVASVCTANTTSSYLATLSSKAMSGSVNFASTSWASFFEDDPDFVVDNYQCMRIQTAAFKATNTAIVLSEKELVFTLKINVKTGIDASILSGAIFMDYRMCRTPETNSTKYPTCVALQKRNPLTNAYVIDTINLAPDVSHANLNLPISDVDTELAAKTGSTTVVDYENRYVYGLAEELTLASFASDYAQVIGTGTITCTDTVLHTGSIIQVMNGGVCRAQYTVIIYGDVDSNGTADGNDSFLVNMINAGMLSPDSLTEAQKLAADPNHDGVIDAADAALLEDAGLLKQTVSQVIA